VTAPTYTLAYSSERCVWILRNDNTGEIKRKFLTRRAATDPVVLEALLGADASVRIEDPDGRICSDSEDARDPP
jgi:hypothetical protein